MKSSDRNAQSSTRYTYGNLPEFPHYGWVKGLAVLRAVIPLEDLLLLTSGNVGQLRPMPAHHLKHVIESGLGSAQCCSFFKDWSRLSSRTMPKRLYQHQVSISIQCNSQIRDLANWRLSKLHSIRQINSVKLQWDRDTIYHVKKGKLPWVCPEGVYITGED